MAGSVSKLGFVLLGKTGAGKSAFGNFLLRKKAFKSGLNSSSVTKEPKSDFSNRGNICVTVVDNPGLFSEDLPILSTATAIQDSIKKVGHDDFVFLLVIRLGRYTAEDNDTMDFLTIMFGRNLMQHTIIIFTNEDQVSNDGQKIDDLIEDFVSMPKRKELFERCWQKYLTVYCKESNEDIQESKWNQLLQMVMTITDNGEKFYREDLLHVYKDVLVKYAESWTNKRLTVKQMEIIMRSQVNECQKEIEKLKREKEEQNKLTEELRADNKRMKTMINIVKVGALVGGGVVLTAGTGALIGAGAAAAIASITLPTSVPTVVAPAVAMAVGAPGLYFTLSPK